MPGNISFDTTSIFPNKTRVEEPSRSCSPTLHKAELPLLLMVAAIGNLVATVTMARLQRTYKARALWILNVLAGNDLFTSVDLLLLSIVNMITCDSLRDTLFCNILGWLGMSSLGFSLALVALINIERYLMVVHPIFHHLHVKRSSLLVCVSLALTISLLLCGLPLAKVGAPYMYYGDNRICGFDWSPWRQNDASHATLVLFNALYLVALVLMVLVCNLAVHIRLHRRNQVFAQQATMNNQASADRTNKFSILTRVVAVVNCICSLPFAVKLMVAYNTGRQSLQNLEDSITSILLFCTPIVNPLLYFFFNKTYRDYFLRAVMCGCRAWAARRVAPQTPSGAGPSGTNRGAQSRTNPQNTISIQVLSHNHGNAANTSNSINHDRQLVSTTISSHLASGPVISGSTSLANRAMSKASSVQSQGIRNLLCTTMNKGGQDELVPDY